VTGVSVAGTEFYDNPAGFICNASCSTTGTGTCHIAAAVTASPLLVPLTINSVTFNSPTQVTLNLNTVGATAGTHTIQIRNPDGQATTFNLQILPVLASSAPLGGKIVNSQNQPIPNVTVSLADTQSGLTQTAQTNSTGDYVFDKTLVGQSYVATPSRQGFTFEPQSRVISHQEENLTVDFVGTSSVVSQNVFNDFDGDGKTDFAVFRPTERNWYIWQSQSNTMRVENWGLASDTLAPADFDGDGKTDLAVYRPSEGNWYIRRSSGGNPQTLKLGGKGDIPVAGDYDGDAKADIAVWRPKNGTWSIIQTSDNQTRQISWGTSGDRPIPRDFDGDGKVDPTVYRPSDGRWYLMYSANSGTNSIPFGVSSDAVTPADFDGDGKTDIAVYRGDAGAWFVQKSSDSNAEITLFGLNGDKTVVGDYDGDGRNDFALFRPSDSMWYVKQTNGGFIAFKWGASGDYPAIPGYLK
ncbi:MAG TPA: FG-GAP-like repeat-containing protein, partial [Pyrinomonadaceae bacterium]|nr:FG-GAP-like repeat-containing protein [Pyrinomonadaceae bacterium]